MTFICHAERSEASRFLNLIVLLVVNEILRRSASQNDIKWDPFKLSETKQAHPLCCCEIATSPYRAPRNDKDAKGSFPSVISSEPRSGDREIPILLFVKAPSLEQATSQNDEASP